MSKIVSLILILTLMVCSSVHAQIPSLQWQKALGGTQQENDNARGPITKLIKTSDQGSIIIGTSYSSDGDVSQNFGLHDLWVVKMNNKGVIQWEKTFGGEGWDYANDIRQTNDGGYIICGITSSQNGDFAHRPGAFDIWVVKLSADGKLEWQKFYGGSSYEHGEKIVEVDDSGYLIGGWAESVDGDVSGNHGSGDIWLVRIDKTGNILWQKCFGGGYLEICYSLERTTDNGFIIGGTQAQTGSNIIVEADFEAIAIKIDAAGNEIWQKKYGGSYYEDIRKIIPVADGGYVFAGSTMSNDKDVSGNHPNSLESHGYGFDEWVVKLDNAGNIQWQRSLGGKWWELGYDIIEFQGKYMVAGHVNSNDGDVSGNHGGVDAWITSLDLDGTLLSQKCYGGSESEVFKSLVKIKEDAVMAGGTTISSDGDISGHHGNGDLWVVTLDNNPYQYNIIKGKVYKDENGNGEQDAAENLHDTRTITIKDKDGFTTGYKMNVPGVFEIRVDTGRFTTWFANDDANYRAVPKEKFINFSSYWKEDVLNIGLVPTALISAVSAEMITQGGAKPGLTNHYSLHYSYNGTRSSVNGVLKLIKDSKVSFVSASLPLLRTGGDTLFFRVENLLPTIPAVMDIQFGVPALPDVVIGDSLKYSYNLMPATVDSMYFTQWDTLYHEIIKPTNVIKGNAYIDQNGNGRFDEDEYYFFDAFVKSEKGAESIGSYLLDGSFLNIVDTGKYETRVYLEHPYYEITPAVKVSEFANYYNKDSFDFALKPIPGISDLSINVYSYTPAKPGFNNDIGIVYFNHGTEPIANGIVRFAKDSKTDLLSAYPAPTSIVGDTLVWQLANLQPLDLGFIRLELKIQPPPQTNLGDTLHFAAFILPVENDQTAIDNSANLAQTLVGAFDPNDKIEVHAGAMNEAEVLNGEYLTYRIRFQNTGNAPATFVYVMDTLDARLDWNSLQMIEVSHPYQMSIKDNNQIRWRFDNIHLPDSNINEPASHGHIIYRIKPRSSLLPGDTIRNGAGIYFDYNLPVATNISNTVVMNLSSLPVTLNSFTGSLAGSVVKLQWETSMENQVNRFEVQRSSNGTDFINIGSVTAHNLAHGSTYSFNDRSPLPGYNHYRLVTVDQDGSRKQSGIVLINFKDSDDIISTVSPNPTAGSVTLKLQGQVQGVVVLSLYDFAGRKVYSRSFGRQHSTTSTIELPAGNLVKGAYILQLTIKGKVHTHKVIVQ